MKYASAIILMVATISSAEPPAPRGGYSARQRQNNINSGPTPYPPRGIRPNGPAFNLPQPPRGLNPNGVDFNLPQRNQRQQNISPEVYGAPAQVYGPPEIITEIPTTTEYITEETTISQTENLELQPENEKLQAKQTKPANSGALYVLVPQTQNLFYSAPVTASISTSNAKLVAQPEFSSQRLIPVQAVPAFAKLVEQPTQYAKIVEQPAQFVYEQYQFAPVLAKVQEEPLLRYQTVAYASPDYSAAYVQTF